MSLALHSKKAEPREQLGQSGRFGENHTRPEHNAPTDRPIKPPFGVRQSTEIQAVASSTAENAGFKTYAARGIQSVVETFPIFV